MDDETYMRMALELAASVPHTSPNPRVGAVIVRDSEILAQAAHRGAGTQHAEAAALEGIDARGATVYVNLEPCSHHGRMPPCAPALIEAGVARVVAAMEDPDERVAGQGFDLLAGAGVAVTTGVLETEAKALNRAFVHHRTMGRPLLTLKLASSLDGRMAAADGSSRWITGPSTRRYVHARRLEADAVMVGAGTVLADDPSLTVREVPADRQPARIVVDPSGRVPATAKVFDGDGAIVVTTERSSHERQISWKERGAEVLVVPEADGGVDPAGLLAALGQRDWLEILCEGGPALASSLLRAGVVDRLELHYAPLLLGEGPSLRDLGVDTMSNAHRWKLTSARVVDQDTLLVLERPS